MPTKIHHRVGRVVHYYPRAHVAAVALIDHIKNGDTLHFEGKETDFLQKLQNIQGDEKDVRAADGGELVGIPVLREVQKGDEVHREVTLD